MMTMKGNFGAGERRQRRFRAVGITIIAVTPLQMACAPINSTEPAQTPLGNRQE
jgi:hypothetical protein